MAKDAQDEFLGGGGLALKFAEVGDNYTLKITEEPDVVAIRDYDDDSIILTWPDGREKKQMIIYGTLTDDSEGWSDDPDDTGDRRLYVKGYMAGALKDALKAAKARKVTPGGELYVEFSEEGVAKSKKHKNPKFFDMEWTADVHKVSVAKKVDTSEFENDEEDEAPVAPRKGRAAAAETKAPARRGRAAAQEEEAEEEAPATPARRGRGRAAAPKAEETVTGRAASRSAAARKAAATAAAAEDDQDDEPPF